MRVLLGSGGFRTPERIGVLTHQMRSFFGSIRRLLFVPYASGNLDGYAPALIERGLHAGYELDPIHRHPDPAEAIRRAEGLYVGGGNTFRLLDALYRHGLLEPIRERVRNGAPYLGISAGCNVACPTLKTTNDMPIVQPPSFTALELVPFQVNPHYYEGQFFLRGGESYVPYFGETRDERIREFHEMNDTPVVGLWEGGVLRVEPSGAELIGAPARVLRKGREPVDVRPGGDIDALLRG
jgi:dipeptidase E